MKYLYSVLVCLSLSSLFGCGSQAKSEAPNYGGPLSFYVGTFQLDFSGTTNSKLIFQVREPVGSSSPRERFQIENLTPDIFIEGSDYYFISVNCTHEEKCIVDEAIPIFDVAPDRFQAVEGLFLGRGITFEFVQDTTHILWIPVSCQRFSTSSTCQAEIDLIKDASGH